MKITIKESLKEMISTLPDINNLEELKVFNREVEIRKFKRLKAANIKRIDSIKESAA